MMKGTMSNVDHRAPSRIDRVVVDGAAIQPDSRPINVNVHHDETSIRELRKKMDDFHNRLVRYEQQIDLLKTIKESLAVSVMPTIEVPPARVEIIQQQQNGQVTKVSAKVNYLYLGVAAATWLSTMVALLYAVLR